GNNFTYLSGTIHAKELIEVNSSYPNYLICADFMAPTILGTWPAFWLTATSWPPEVDILEFKGNTLNNFNIFINEPHPAYSDQINITSPANWNTFCFYMNMINNSSNVNASLSLNNMQNITHTAENYVGKQFWLVIDLQMEGSSGKDGPLTDTFYYIRNVNII
ncbi:15566_t:CDS:2, partial [Dentiscutata heterogama]